MKRTGQSGADQLGVPRENLDAKDIDVLREYYDSADVAEHFREAIPDTRTTAEVMVSTSIRLPQTLVNQVREQAAALGIGNTALMRQWIIERAVAPDASTVVSVADLQRFIAERARPAAL